MEPYKQAKQASKQWRHYLSGIKSQKVEGPTTMDEIATCSESGGVISIKCWLAAAFFLGFE
jgi:hypothetical protein